MDIIFKFKYGYILIIMNKISKRNKIIYIPLWFYSNTFDNGYHYVYYRFTFHYGSILIIIAIFIVNFLLYLHSTIVLF